MIKKILLFYTSWPYPADNGKKVMLKSILEFLINKYGEETIDLVLIDNEKITNNPFKNLSITQITPNTLAKIKNIFLMDRSLQERILYDKKIERLLLQKLKSSNYKLILFDTLRTGQYILNVPYSLRKRSKYILYMDDLFHIRYEKILNAIETYNLNINELNIFGNFSKHLEKIPLFNFIKKSSKLQLTLLKKEKELIKNREISIISKFDKNLLISHDETQYLKRLTKLDNIYTLPPIVQLTEFEREFINENIFLFIGNLAVPHNRISLQYFIENYVRECIKTIENFKLIIIGKNIAPSLKDLVNKYNNNILYKGYVENIAPYIKKSKGIIIPLLFGSGVKLKTIEALASGLPMVSTSFGIEGIKMENELKVEILENDLSKFCEKMHKLINEKYNKYLSYLEKNNYIKFYSKDNIDKIYNEIFEIKM